MWEDIRTVDVTAMPSSIAGSPRVQDWSSVSSESVYIRGGILYTLSSGEKKPSGGPFEGKLDMLYGI